MEQWKKIPRETKYSISNFGRVRNDKSGRILKADITKRGYLRVTLSNNGKLKHYRIHRLVAEMFVENPHREETVDHVDGDKTNNVYTNLEWCSSTENTKRYWRRLYE